MNLNFDATDPNAWAMVNGASEVRLTPERVDNDYVNLKFASEYDFNDTGIFLGIDRLRSCAYVRSSRLSSRVKSGLSAPMTVARKPNTNRFWTTHRLSSLPCAWCPIRADESTRSRSKIFAV